jgi:hypothetical protein
MRKIIIAFTILFTFVFFTFESQAQKFIKYIFLKNQVKVVVQTTLIESQQTDTAYVIEQADLLKSWVAKNNTDRMDAYLFSSEEANDIVNATYVMLNNFPGLADKEAATEKKVILPRKRKAAVLEYKINKKYHLVFCTAIPETGYILFHFQCSEKNKRKYEDGLNESIQTLFIQ